MICMGIISGCGLQAPTAPEVPNTEKTTEQTAAEITLVYAEVNPLDSIVGQTGTAFAEKVAELSGGRIYIDVQASGVLGSETVVLDEMLAGGGTVDMSRISAFALTSYGGEKSKLLSVPFTFEDREHFWKFVDSDLADEFLAEPSENGSGVKGLFYGEEGFRHFFTSTEVKDREDLVGLKLRVSNDPVMVGLVEGLGASATAVDYNELYSALQTGVIDGAEQPVSNYKSKAFNEVAPTIILDGHTLGAIQVIISEKVWNELSEEDRNILIEAGEYASKFNRIISEQAESKVIKELKAEGVNVVEVTDKTPWKEAVKDVIENETAENKELYQQILDLAN
ncbi:C4-dicarboxylate ABC transporter substrate-binding protein [Candidatus Epulonipiscium fishelsonii]|uniref:C4-dicarboxylate ABC transporter substrate-binding protein n=1 Tax=Candidatus Epulonipiscium fishelsonii TaxID=77094 RepID=A0ACC8X8B0_9FIRM|nr:C4-dicarboxylate ABC transporter substrate-binding protein [Epulopiscium sp. SCG-D08WGA-EpuloA1]OON90504.1 MAG: C4-dicarboxylate ABC transporter substrate-binding protein [Epulopiscium sp. AS2M-Bin002]